MKIKALILILLLFNTYSFAQLRDLKELINNDEDAIFLINEWKENANNEIIILDKDSIIAKEALYNTQVTTRSPMGAIIYHTGGILINKGWLRIYGSGHEKLNRNLPEWNKGKTFETYGDTPGHLIIADDAVGGFFLLNGGDLGSDLGKIYYLSPDYLEPEPLELSYTDFILFCFNGDIDNFYKDLRWKDWENDFNTLSTNEAFIFYPYLWTTEGENINKVQKKKASIKEIYKFRTQ